MAKPRSQFTRLGAHVARDTAREVRERAATGEPSALAELEALKAATSPDSLREKVWEIVRGHLADAAGILTESGGGPPRSLGREPKAYAETLRDWSEKARVAHEFDTPEGRAVEIVRLCAEILELIDHSQGVVFRLGVVLGYGLSQKNHLLVREFADGPALARESALQAARAEGGKVRAQQSAERDGEIRAAFAAARASNPSLTPNGWANDRASQWGLSGDRVRKILTTSATPES